MSGAKANILERKLAASSNRRAQASLQNSLVQKIEKTTSRVYLDFLKSDVQARVSQQVVDSQVRTIGAMTSALFGTVVFGDDMSLLGFDAQFVDAAITLIAGGTRGAEVDRPITKTDVAIAASIFNRVLSGVFTSFSLGADGPIAISGFETEKAPLAFLLAEKKYALLRIEITDVAQESLGQIELVLPLSCIERISEQEHHALSAKEHKLWQTTMIDLAHSAPIELDTVIQRMRLPLGEILDLKKGDFLEIPQGSLENLSLEGRGRKTHIIVFRGHLGAQNSRKAFKVTGVIANRNVRFQPPL